MQPIVEPDRGLCDNHKPNRFFGIERKRMYEDLATAGSSFFTRGIYMSSSINDILYAAASIWNELTEYNYIWI